MVEEPRVTHFRAVYRMIDIQYWSQIKTRFFFIRIYCINSRVTEIVSVKNGYDWDIPFFLTEDT